jgi:predicted XRE-type DNA-binding protein
VNQTPTERTAEAVRIEMARHKMKPVELSRLLGRSRPTISRRLDATHAFRVDELITLAAHLGVPVSTFLPDEERAA